MFYLQRSINMKDVVLKNSEVYSLNGVITAIQNQDEAARQNPSTYKPLPSKFTWALSRTKKLIADVVETIEEFRAPSKEFQTYTQHRIKLCNELALKDESGNPKIENNEFQFTEENSVIFRAKLKELQETHAVALEIENTKLAQLKERIEEETTIRVFVVGIEYVPDLPTAFMDVLAPMIE